ncbi:MAG: rhodanese-like domain-containing protein [Pseudomonadota bacterium]
MTDTATRGSVFSRRNALWAIVIVGAGVVGSRALLSRPNFDGQALGVAEAHKLAGRGDIVLIDIRRPDEWKRTGIGEGAHAIDMRRDDFIEAMTAVAGDDKTAPVALICAAGVRSARLSRRLTEAGYSNIIDVPEGMLGSSAGPGWVRSGLPTRAFEGSNA